MLGSSFLENTAPLHPGERKVYSVIVEEADFVTIYWLLKFVYANWLHFRKEDDPREAVDGIGAGWSARGLSAPGAPDEWEWKTFSKGSPSDSGAVSDARSVTSAGSAPSGNGGSNVSPQAKDKRPYDSRQSSAHGPVPATPSRNASAPKTASRSPAAPRRSGGGASTGPGAGPSLAASSTQPGHSPRSGKDGAVPLSPSGGTFAAPAHYAGPAPSANPLSPRQQRTRPDPHPHPTPPPPPASALSMYQVAHRYAMPGLAALAMEHIMSTITPQASFAVLLATAAWDELHSLVEVRSCLGLTDGGFVRLLNVC